MHFELHFWLLNSPFPKLLDLRLAPHPHWLQHRWGWPLRIRPCHRACWSFKAWNSRNVHILLLLDWDCTSLRHSLHFSYMAYTLHCLLYSLPYLSYHCPPFHLRIPKMVPRSGKNKRSHETHAHHCQVEQKPPP